MISLRYICPSLLTSSLLWILHYHPLITYPLSTISLHVTPSSGDPNKYTTRCKSCGSEFVPRFTVKCDNNSHWLSQEGGGTSTSTSSGTGGDPKRDMNKETGQGQPQGGSGAGDKLWCELLSPWTLRKEMFNVLFRDGISTLLSKVCTPHTLHFL